jgi:heat-inducible transcriptional repressor
MAALEDEGYIAQPHTSAGRVPTDQGYRLFVDRLAGVKPLSAAERRAIATFLDQAVDLDDVMARTVRLLAQLTQQVALVQYPSLTRSTVRHVEIVGLTGTRVMLVLITDTGRVEQRVVDTPAGLGEQTLADLRARLNTAAVGRRFVEVTSAAADVVESFTPEERPGVAVVVAAFLETVVERHDERVVLSGTANLTRYGSDFPQTVRPVLEALEEQVVLMRLLGEATSPEEFTVRIGHENRMEALTSTSVVALGYGGPDGDPLAQLGVVGPTHMDYPGTMAAVRAVARYLGRILAER